MLKRSAASLSVSHSSLESDLVSKVGIRGGPTNEPESVLRERKETSGDSVTPDDVRDFDLPLTHATAT